MKREDRDEETGERREAQHRLEDVWKQLPTEWRETLLLYAVADEGLTIRQIASRMNTELGGSSEKGLRVLDEYETRPSIKRMFRCGQLDRVEEPFQGKVRYRYFRNWALDGPIAALEHAYRSEEVA